MLGVLTFRNHGSSGPTVPFWKPALERPRRGLEVNVNVDLSEIEFRDVNRFHLDMERALVNAEMRLRIP
jgi:hypothetical protein